jgi:hypothetical protein
MVIASVGQIPGWAGANYQFWVKGPAPFCKFEEPDSDSNIVSIYLAGVENHCLSMCSENHLSFTI